VLEKLRPIEAKLKYQIDKVRPHVLSHPITHTHMVPTCMQLVKTASTGVIQESNAPLSFKPKPASLVAKVLSMHACMHASLHPSIHASVHASIYAYIHSAAAIGIIHSIF
jgi:hypothetical protein